jgi:hypothetical protein
LGKKRAQLRDKCSDLCEPEGLDQSEIFISKVRDCIAQGLDQGEIRRLRSALAAAPPQDERAISLSFSEDLLGQAGLAHPRFPADEHKAPLPRLRILKVFL